jgi:hypothetical protein
VDSNDDSRNALVVPCASPVLCRDLVDGRHAATHVALYRRARHRSVRAKHAAIAREGLEPFAAPFAVIEELAGIGRHRLDSLMAAFRASQGGLKLHIGHRE